MGITDLDIKSNQPIFCNDATLVSVGGMHNCAELRERCKKKDPLISASSDSEVLLQADYSGESRLQTRFEAIGSVISLINKK